MSETDVQALIDGIAAELDAAVALDDTELRLLAHTAHDGAIDEARRSSILGRRVAPEVRSWIFQWGIREAIQPVRTPADTSLGIFARWCVPVRFRARLLGYIWILDTHGIAESELDSAVETAEQIGVLLYRRRLLNQVDTDLLRLLLIPNPENESAAAEARAVGSYTHKGPTAVIIIGASNGDALSPSLLSDLTLVVQRAAQQPSPEAVLAGVISGFGVLLAPLRNREDLTPAWGLSEKVRALATQVGPELEIVAAIGGAAELERASRSYAEAQRTMRIVRAMPDLGPIVAWENLGVFRALALVPAEDVKNAVLDPRVSKLLCNNELAVTAETFLDLAGNVQETAARLYLHRTTLYQRLERISSLYKLDLRRSGDHRLITHLGLKLTRLVSVSSA